MELLGQKQLEIQYLVFELFESDGFLRIILCMPHVNLSSKRCSCLPASTEGT